MTPMDKYQALAQLQDRNETLFFKAVIENIKEMAPIVYTPTGSITRLEL
jgi:malic enzyme